MAFLAALAKFTDYTIIWRYEGEFPEAHQYEHIHLVKWLPQKDLLGERRIFMRTSRPVILYSLQQVIHNTVSLQLF